MLTFLGDHGNAILLAIQITKVKFILKYGLETSNIVWKINYTKTISCTHSPPHQKLCNYDRT